ncbi:RNA methyltransferase [Thermobispora bispora]|uniref:tRNA/rRNA methyltransferase (SpoU) n=1 Tax=Thermobispora bispora (strain ATCC 19993 / DSM 43833 / CBS 139.67 / JCM 10125 / KCTC 9307 / NBRC 14880 / R51) TaxID=469371 RepID=D6Y1Z5_THEBD|nr:RNA methyltransferase [Thermobispora bispora]MBO2473334.1 RNA methyltransferase [Actinomycetales bacterium]MDI9580923.1 RNA methyltransferase [Thermobispora sp.]ADG88751.1 tRNA/rRNA methyltransferase (SpoU) [Thermobispora bispora DSM 43833]MBX6166186.1 RNA methyltransferase [Thermobispora bispora]QSI48521.1 RNA methyltransferase [Thermobispora bispora]
MAEITNVKSPRVKAVRRLTKRAFRDRDRAFLAEGPQAIREALRTPGVTVELYATTEAEARHPDIVAAARDAGVPVHRTSGEVMAELTQTVTPQGLVAVCRFVHVPLEEAVRPGARLVAVLAHVRDPGNAGTVLRTADAAGADAVVFTDASVDPYNGKCVRASAGSLFHLPVSINARFPETVRQAREAGLRILAADASGARTLDEVDLSRPTAWVFGNEAWGLPPELLELADEVVRVPIYGRAESLNLATAAAVCLYASARAQRRSLHPVEDPSTSLG